MHILAYTNETSSDLLQSIIIQLNLCQLGPIDNQQHTLTCRIAPTLVAHHAMPWSVLAYQLVRKATSCDNKDQVIHNHHSHELQCENHYANSRSTLPTAAVLAKLDLGHHDPHTCCKSTSLAIINKHLDQNNLQGKPFN